MSIAAALVRRIGKRLARAIGKSRRPASLTTTRRRNEMRFMVIVKADQDTEDGVLPTEAELAEMGAYNEELVRAGVLLAGEGLLASSKGARVRFDAGGGTTVVDGPFAETKEILGGFNLIEAADMDEAVRIAAEFPWATTGCVEVRQVHDIDAERRRVGA
jgi:hypothetical protein